MLRQLSLVVSKFVILLSCIISNLVLAQEAPKSPALNLPQINLSSIGDFFSAEIRELKKLVAEGKFTEADAYFIQKQDYFTKRFMGNAGPIPEEFIKLGEHVWATRYQLMATELQAKLVATDSVLDRNQWKDINATKLKAIRWLEAIDSDKVVQLAMAAQSQRGQLSKEVNRLTELAKSFKPQALAMTFEDVIAKGAHDPVYVLPETFSIKDYLGSPDFQAKLIQSISATSDKAAYLVAATRLKPYVDRTSEEALDRDYIALVRRDLLADQQITLDEIPALAATKTPFGGGADELAGIVTIGYVDLTSASFKDRNVFDFEVAFKQDAPFAVTPASETIFANGDLSKFDYLFITDLAAAKVNRQFKSKQEIKSRVKTGTREMPNPEYVRAMSEYQQAMAQYQRAQINAAIPKACQGWGCVLQGLADGLQQGGAKSTVDRASSQLASTNQNISVPVYSEYSYQEVEVNGNKTADVNYYIIDVKRKQIIRNNFSVNDNEVFRVAYNIRDEDPDKTSILRNVKAEDEVTAWEKRSISVSISTLFDPSNLTSATKEPFLDFPAFFRTLSTRTFAAATPTYAKAGSNLVATGVNSNNNLEQPVALKSSASSSQTIADERFDSIVILRNSNSTGTGFYVTPDLLLTAYHVVKGGSLVEITFYDGTKTYGKVVDHDVRLDLALIRPQTTGKPLKIHTGPIRLGETVEAIGHPKGYEFTITRGVISAMRKQRSAIIASDVLVEFIQTDTPISPGNSGGPLLLKDAVIGVNDWIRVDKGSQNLNFSVSYNEIRGYLDRFTKR